MSTSALKWTAFVLMVLDHLGEFFPGQIPLWFRYLGRMSAPLFLFCLAVGMRKTRSRTRYIKRLWIGSAVMGSGNLLLTLLYPNAPVAVSNNILSTMVVIAVLIWIFESFDDNYRPSQASGSSTRDLCSSSGSGDCDEQSDIRTGKTVGTIYQWTDPEHCFL